MTSAHSAYVRALGVESPADTGGDVHRLPFQRSVLGRPGFLHGGAIAGLLAITCDARAEAEGGGHDAATTTMYYLRGGRERDTYASAQLTARTSRFLLIEATAWQESPDKPIAMMSRTYLRRQDLTGGGRELVTLHSLPAPSFVRARIATERKEQDRRK